MKPLSRQHSIYLQDDVWNNLVSHSARRGESASQFINLVLTDALGMLPSSTKTAYTPGDISASAIKMPDTTTSSLTTQMEHTAAAPTHRPTAEPPTHRATKDRLHDDPAYAAEVEAEWQRTYGKKKRS